MKQQPDLLFRGRRKFLWLIFATSCLFLPTLAFAPRLRPGTRGTSSSVLAGSKRSGSKAKEKGGKWERRRSTSSTRQSQVERYSPRPSPIINTYDDSRNIQTNLKRLRNPISCDHFGSCPGCVVDDHVGEIEIIRSAKRYFSSTYIRKNRMDVQLSGEDAVIEHEDDSFYDVVVPSDITQWRTQAKLVVAPKSSSWAKDGCVFGLYKRSSHDIIEIPNCQVHHPSINQAVRALEMATNKVGTPAFSEGSREGGLRYVQLQVERITGKISLTLVWASSDLKYTQPSLSRLTKDLNRLEPELWHSMWCHCNDGPGNNIFTRNPGNWYRLSGNEFLREPIAVGDHGWLYFSPLTFRQGNMDGFDILANDVARAIPGGSKVCELYAGVGLLGLTALVHHSGENPLTWVRCSDENPANLRSFKRSINSLPQNVAEYEGGKKKGENSGLTLGELMTMMESGTNPGDDRVGRRASYMVASAAKALKTGQALGAEVLVVDPPRRGLEDKVLEELCKPVNVKQPNVESPAVLTIPDELVNWTNDVKTIIYVSCGFDALARDCERLLSSRGGWVLESATGYVIFPGSNHVETLCIFKRK